MSEVTLGPGIRIRITVEGGGDVRSVNGVRPDAKGNVQLDGGVRTVNGVAPDAQGNVEVKIPKQLPATVPVLPAVPTSEDAGKFLRVQGDGSVGLEAVPDAEEASF